jgi:HEAT repeat protein
MTAAPSGIPKNPNVPPDKELSREDKVRLLTDNLFSHDVERRLLAIKSIGSSKDPWLGRALLYTLTDEDVSVAKAARESLAKKSKALLPLFVKELGSPSFEVRAGALQMLGLHADLDRAVEICEQLFDYNVNVREAARGALFSILERFDPTTIDQEMREKAARVVDVFAVMTSSPNTGVHSLAQELLLSFGRYFSDKLWPVYLSMNARSRKQFHIELLKLRTDWSVQLIYEGICSPQEELSEAISVMLAANLDQEDLNVHLTVLAQFSDEQRRRIFQRFVEHDILPKVLRVSSWLKQEARLTLMRMIGLYDVNQYRDYILDCLSLTDRETRIEALSMAGNLDEFLPRELLIQLLKESDQEVVVAVLDYIKQRGGFDMVKDIIPYMRSEDDRIRKATLDTTFSISREHLISRYDQLRPSAREDLARFLQKMNSEFVSQLAAELEEVDEDERIKLMEVMMLVAEDEAAQKEMRQLTRSRDSRIRATATRAFSKLKSMGERVAALVPLLRDTDSRVRANAIEEVPVTEDVSIINMLVEFTRSDSNRERANAIFKLWDLGYTDYEISLVRMLEDPDPWVRASGYWALCQIDAPHLLDYARAALSDDSNNVRIMAMKALGRSAPEEEVRNFTRFLDDEDPDIKRTARDVLRTRLKIEYEMDK